VHYGIKVYGRQLNVFVDENGRVLSVSGNYKHSNVNNISCDFDIVIDNFKKQYGLQVQSYEEIIYNQNEEDSDEITLKTVHK
jgi:Zn-dependent metalloprotease